MYLLCLVEGRRSASTLAPRHEQAQSLGCVELPLAASAEIWPYTPIGTLVTIEA
jgi:hypothetical protein